MCIKLILAVKKKKIYEFTPVFIFCGMWHWNDKNVMCYVVRRIFHKYNNFGGFFFIVCGNVKDFL